MGRKNNRRGCRQPGQDVIDDILYDAVRKPQERAVAKNEQTEADRAYAHAAEVCDRIIRELDEQLED